LTRSVRGGHSTAPKIKNARGAFNGVLRCSVPGLPSIDFHTTVYDLMDAGVAIVHLDGAKGGPAGIMAVVPAARRNRLRPEFAFEFVTLLSFLGAPTRGGAELAVCDYIENVLRTQNSATQVFTVEAAHLGEDDGIVLSAHFEHLAAAMVDWLARKDAEGDEEDEEEIEESAPACAAA